MVGILLMTLELNWVDAPVLELLNKSVLSAIISKPLNSIASAVNSTLKVAAVPKLRVTFSMIFSL